MNYHGLVKRFDLPAGWVPPGGQSADWTRTTKRNIEAAMNVHELAMKARQGELPYPAAPERQGGEPLA